jgi:hypothetical protein
VLDLRLLVVDKLPEDGTLVPKHVGADTLREMYFMICLLYFD